MKPYVNITKDSFTLFAGSLTKTVNKNHEDFNKLIDWYRAGNDDALENYLTEFKKKIENPYKTLGFTVNEDRVCINGEFLPTALSNRLINHADQNLPVDRLLKFWENLKENPSFKAVEAVFEFLERNHCPLTKDGYFIAYKSVNADFTSRSSYGPKKDNTPGKNVEQDRRTVDDDNLKACSWGLHVGGLTYPASYRDSNSKLVEVIVNPADVVSVPTGGEDKLRCCKYFVAREIPWGEEYKNVEHYPLDDDCENEPECCFECGEYSEDCDCDENY